MSASYVDRQIRRHCERHIECCPCCQWFILWYGRARLFEPERSVHPRQWMLQFFPQAICQPEVVMKPLRTVLPSPPPACRLCENAALPDPSKAEILAHRRHRQSKANPNWCPIGPLPHQGKLLDPDHLCELHRQEMDGLGSKEHWPAEWRLSAEQRAHAYRLGMTPEQYTDEVLAKKP